MQWFVSGYNSQLSDLHPLKISNNLSTTLTQLRLRHLLCCIHEETKTYADTDGSNSPEFLNWRADPAFFFVSFHPSRNLLQMSSFCLKYFSYIYSNMQWFLSGCNSQLSNLHPLKISNSLSTTLTQLRRQRRKADWVSISSVVKVDASTCLNITRSGSVFWRVREQQKTLQLSLLTKDLSPWNKEKMRFAYDEQGVIWTNLIGNILFTPRVKSSSQNIGSRLHEPCFRPCCFKLAAVLDGRKSKQRTKAKTRELMAFIFTM